MKSTGNYSDEIKKLMRAIEEADAIVIGAGAGLSTSAGFVYNGERFEKHFSELRRDCFIPRVIMACFNAVSLVLMKLMRMKR